MLNKNPVEMETNENYYGTPTAALVAGMRHARIFTAATSSIAPIVYLIKHIESHFHLTHSFNRSTNFSTSVNARRKPE